LARTPGGRYAGRYVYRLKKNAIPKYLGPLEKLSQSSLFLNRLKEFAADLRWLVRRFER
jgi:hypothetical protein